MKRACVFLRVSTKKQDEQNQWTACEALCKAQGWEVVKVIRAKTSGTKTGPEKLEAFAGAIENRWDVIVVWSLDRWSREGILRVFDDMAKLQRAGKMLASVKDPLTLDSMAGEMWVAMSAIIAKYEAVRRRERTLEGLEESKRKLQEFGSYYKQRPDGTMKKVERIGREAVAVDDELLERAAALRASGVGWRRMAQELKFKGSWMTLRNRLMAIH